MRAAIRSSVPWNAAAVVAGALVGPSALAGTLDLTHSGRLLDPGGAPISGEHRLDVSLYGASPTALRTWTFNPVALSDGFYTVRLDGVDAAWFGQDLELGVAVDSGTELSPRQALSSVPHAQRAAVAGAVPIDVDGLGVTCGQAGAMSWDAVADALMVCDGYRWQLLLQGEGPQRTIALSGGTRAWSDGTVAASCDAYRHPADPFYKYEGAVGSGTYTIDPLGGAPFRVWCEMDYQGGGWTKVMSLGAGTTTLGTGAVNENGTWTTQGQGTAAGKVSNAAWAALGGSGAFLMRVTSPSDGKLMNNGAGALKWVTTNGATWPAWGTSQRPGNYRLECDYDLDGVVDESQTYGADSRSTCLYGTYWLYDHNYTGSPQCYGFGATQLQTNIHFCGLANGTDSEGGVTGTHHLFVRG